MDHVEVAGMRIAFERAGVGPPLVLVHGAVCDRRVWRYQLDALSDEFTVVAWDAPGCGGSADPPESFRLRDYADALAGFIAALGLGRPHLLGHSFGGALLLELYRRHPAVPPTLILVASTAGWAGSLPGAEVEQRLTFALDVADRLPGKFEPTSMRGLFSKVMSPETVDGLVAIMSEIRPVATRAMAHALAEADLRDVLMTIDVPTLLIYGDADERSPLSVAEDLRDGIPGSRLVVMAGLGHECYLESPEPFNAEVRGFLQSVA
ncbi:MAG TPA: alpha/beta hydrolase [Gaiellaceae bacterium]